MTDGRLSVGLWHIADERIFAGEIIYPYRRFDYVVRNYYSEAKPFFNMTLRALGNLTCGTSEGSLPSNNPREPRWGVHWIHLDSHGLPVEMRRSAGSVWPTSQRKVNCSFMGRRDAKRSRGERLQMKVAMEALPELGCNVEFTNGFAQGHSSFQYFNEDIATAKIGLAPRGTAVETHRLSEILRMGTVAAVEDEAYLHATFIDVPAIIGSDWNETARKMKYCLFEAPDELEKLAKLGAEFSAELGRCVRQDLDVIFRGAFGLTHELAWHFG